MKINMNTLDSNIFSTSRTQLEKSARIKLQQSLKMYQQVPLYSNRISAHFEDIPILTATDVSRYSPPYSDALIYDRSKLGPVLRSGGSTGRRKTIVHSWEFNERVMQLGLRGLHAAISEIPKRIANCFSAGDLLGSFLFAEGVAQRLDVTYLPIGTRLPLEEIYELITCFKVDTIMATPSFCIQFFTYLHTKPALKFLKQLLYLGEIFDPKSKAMIQKAYPTLNIAGLSYTTTETGPIGFQCRKLKNTDHHINEDSVKVEILCPETGRPLSTNKLGDVIVTTYLNNGMPMLRYKTGDHGMILSEDCKCGCQAHVLRLMGRAPNSLKIRGLIIYQEHVLTLLNKHVRLSASEVQVVEKQALSRTRIEILLNKEAVSEDVLPAIQEEFEKDYNFFHIKHYFGIDGLFIQRCSRTEFYVSLSGKIPFFYKEDTV